MYVFDTDHLSILRWKNQPEYSRLANQISNHSAQLFFVPIISFHEMVMGANNYIQQGKSEIQRCVGYQMLKQTLDDFSRVQILPYEANAATIFENLRNQKVRIGTMDLRIASIVLNHKFILLTRNSNDFLQIPGLTIENWTV